MACKINKIDSNVTGLAIAEEECLKELPVTPKWFEFEPNSYSDFGGEVSNVMREPINPSRQKRKGTVADLDASGGFNADLTQSNLTWLMQGFLFADAREKAKTSPLNGPHNPITSVDGGTGQYVAASGLDIFNEGDLIKAQGFNFATNDGLKRVISAAATAVTVDEVLTSEGPGPTAKLETVGHQFLDGDVDITILGTDVILSLKPTATQWTTLGLTVGEWIFVGGDDPFNRYTNNEPGYARIKEINAFDLHLDSATWTPSIESGAGVELQVFFGTVIRNEKTPSLIKRRTYSIERTLGEDDDGTQSEYLEGSIPNEFSISIPTAEKINADLTFVAMENVVRDGATGVKDGDRVAAPGEEAFNTSSDIFRMQLKISDPSEEDLFAYVSEASVGINNGVSPNKAIGVLGAFDASIGDFEVTGSLTAYFTTVKAIEAVKANYDAEFNVIAAQNNAAVVIDVPLLSLGGGKLAVEKDASITLPLEQMAAECANGYTLLTSWLAYVPDVGTV